MKILICGLPTFGKTTLAKQLQPLLDADWFNADIVREQTDDWDFSNDGRIRQCNRMIALCNISDKEYQIADFVAPTTKIRKLFNADFVIYMDTIDDSPYENTNAIFEAPDDPDLIITEFDYIAEVIANIIQNN